MITKRSVTDLSYKIVGHAIEVHKQLGPGLLESVYEKCLTHELQLNNYSIEQQKLAPIIYKGLEFLATLKADLIVNDLVVVEIKAADFVLPVHEAQLITYMKLHKKPQGLLINFHTDNLSRSLKPYVNEYFSTLP